MEELLKTWEKVVKNWKFVCTFSGRYWKGVLSVMQLCDLTELMTKLSWSVVFLQKHLSTFWLYSYAKLASSLFEKSQHHTPKISPFPERNKHSKSQRNMMLLLQLYLSTSCLWSQPPR